MLDIFSREKKFTSQHKYSVLVDITLKHSHLVKHPFFSQSFAVTFMLFKNRFFFCSCFHLFLESRTSSTHQQFATSYFCPECLVIVANNIIGLQTYSNILIEGILLKMLRSKRELYLEQAI